MVEGTDALSKRLLARLLDERRPRAHDGVPRALLVAESPGGLNSGEDPSAAWERMLKDRGLLP